MVSRGVRPVMSNATRPRQIRSWCRFPCNVQLERIPDRRNIHVSTKTYARTPKCGAPAWQFQKEAARGWNGHRRSLKTLSHSEIETYLATPSWSVKESLSRESPAVGRDASVTKDTLHHLLRLSALPLPTSPEAESKMLRDLQGQLAFVNAVRDVDTTGVEPLVAVRDETAAAKGERTIGLDDKEIQAGLAREEVVGKRGRIRNRRITSSSDTGSEQDVPRGFELLNQAPKRMGNYIVVDTKKD